MTQDYQQTKRSTTIKDTVLLQGYLSDHVRLMNSKQKITDDLSEHKLPRLTVASVFEKRSSSFAGQSRVEATKTQDKYL